MELVWLWGFPSKDNNMVWLWRIPFYRYAIGCALWCFPSENIELVEAIVFPSKTWNQFSYGFFPSNATELVCLWGFLSKIIRPS